MQKKKKAIQSRRLRKLMRAHMIVTMLSLSAYFSVAFFDPGFLSYDLRQKYHALADNVVTVSATVLGVPIKPVVTGVSQCNANILSVELDWGDDVNTYTYDVLRNGLPLVSGISSSGYGDTSVAFGTTYEYIVTAHGPMGPGFATSDSFSIVTLSLCGSGVVDPTVNITSFDGQSVGSYDGMPSIFTRRPIFSGTSNMSNAIIQVVVGPPSSFLAEFTANSNGYFAWQPPFDLSFGTQVFTVTAIDPNDSLRQSSTSLQFEIKNNSGETSSTSHSNGSNKKTSSKVIETIVPSSIIPSAVETPINFSLSVENNDNTVLQGQDLQAVLKITDVAGQYDGAFVPIRYSLIDEKGEVLLSVTRETLLKKGDEIRESLPIALHAVVGEYSLRAEILFDRANVSRTASLTVEALPLFDIGGGVSITYAGIVRNLGWIALVLIISLFLWLFMFMREYGMYLHAIRHITEQQLMNAGFITKRKGVIR